VAGNDSPELDFTELEEGKTKGGQIASRPWDRSGCTDFQAFILLKSKFPVA